MTKLLSIVHKLVVQDYNRVTDQYPVINNIRLLDGENNPYTNIMVVMSRDVRDYQIYNVYNMLIVSLTLGVYGIKIYSASMCSLTISGDVRIIICIKNKLSCINNNKDDISREYKIDSPIKSLNSTNNETSFSSGPYRKTEIYNSDTGSVGDSQIETEIYNSEPGVDSGTYSKTKIYKSEAENNDASINNLKYNQTKIYNSAPRKYYTPTKEQLLLDIDDDIDKPPTFKEYNYKTNKEINSTRFSDENRKRNLSDSKLSLKNTTTPANTKQFIKYKNTNRQPSMSPDVSISTAISPETRSSELNSEIYRERSALPLRNVSVDSILSTKYKTNNEPLEKYQNSKTTELQYQTQNTDGLLYDRPKSPLSTAYKTESSPLVSVYESSKSPPTISYKSSVQRTVKKSPSSITYESPDLPLIKPKSASSITYESSGSPPIYKKPKSPSSITYESSGSPSIYKKPKSQSTISYEKSIGEKSLSPIAYERPKSPALRIAPNTMKTTNYGAELYKNRTDSETNEGSISFNGSSSNDNQTINQKKKFNKVRENSPVNKEYKNIKSGKQYQNLYNFANTEDSEEKYNMADNVLGRPYNADKNNKYICGNNGCNNTQPLN